MNLGDTVMVCSLPGIKWDKLRPGMTGRVVSGPYSVLAPDSDPVWSAVDVAFPGITAPCAIPLLKVVPTNRCRGGECDEGRCCRKHRNESAKEFAWIANAVYRPINGSYEQDMIDAGRGHLLP